MKKKLFYQDGRPLVLPKTVLGEGGEADVFKVSSTHVAKIYKQEDHESFVSLPAPLAQEAKMLAKQKLTLVNKKLREYPQGLGHNVLAPNELILDDKGMVAGFIMRLIDNPLTWLQFVDPARRKGNLANDQITKLLLNLLEGTQSLHDKGVVIGDYNDNNFLIKNHALYFCDADAYQFGRYPCNTFTQTYVDPKICQKAPHSDSMMMAGPHSVMTDWYAFCVFVAQSLLCWHPYIGQHKPAQGVGKIPNGLRPLHRFTILDDKNPKQFRSDVIVPKFVKDLHLGIVTDELAEYLWKVFVKDDRQIFPKGLLENLEWTTCTKCNFYHARHQCPHCMQIHKTLVKSLNRVFGRVMATVLFETQGVILSSVVQHQKLCYVYHDGHSYKREDGLVVANGTLDSMIKFEICGNQTIFGKDRDIFVLEQGKQPIRLETTVFSGYPIFTTNSSYYFWMQNGVIMRNSLKTTILGDSQPTELATALQDKTLWWTGEEFGFGLYGSNTLRYFFVFDTERKSSNDNIAIHLKGEILDASATFTDQLCWFFVKSKNHLGKKEHRVYVIDRHGKVLGELEDSVKHWLRSVRGKAAIGDKCFVNTDEGVYKLQTANGMIHELEHFPDTEPWGDDFTRLHLLDGIVVNDGKKITKLVLT